MRYEGSVYRPPSEAYSLIIQVTIGCAHNKCTFCTMFKEKKFRVRNVKEVLEDLDMARQNYRRINRIFLADGDALVLQNKELLVILDYIKKLFPECERVGIYGSPQDILRKSHEDLVELREHGIGIIYIGAESGSDRVLKAVNKGATRADIIESVRRVETADIPASVTFISGLAGKAGWEDHAIESGTMISEMEASYVGLLTLITEPGAEMHRDIAEGRLELLSPLEVLKETELLLEHANVKKTCVFRSNHASNYVSLKGDLPQDKDLMLSQLRNAMNHADSLKDDRFRML
ncbi:B12-binding domain-containing radical SAM protein [Anoxybacterium hadale]|uniref:B12-binding domain-containing radical SAM protein n=1 Tax=Anoxybacterium hadale TaxID=3408580 RepID=A0ACD1ABG7_9FIRM|nr:B12-binding domain-containing radical SAM protein [Clostridiales bacterium]